MRWSYFSKYVFKYWKLQAVAIVFGFLSIPLSILNPYIAKLIIDKAYAARDFKLFFMLAVLGGVIFVIITALDSLRNYLLKRIKHYVYFDISKDIFSHLQKLPLIFFNEKSAGEHLYKISNDAYSVSGFICDTLPQGVMLFPRFLFILIVIFCLNWKLALFTLAMVPIIFIHPYFFGKWLKEIAHKVVEKSQGIFKRLYEAFSHTHLIKAFGRENYETEKFEAALSEKIDFEIKNAKLSSISNFSGSLLSKIIAAAIAFYGGFQIIKGSMTLGSLSAIMLYLNQLIGLSRSISLFFQGFTLNSVSLSRLSEILDTEPKIIDKKDALDYRILQGAVEFKSVSFGYKKDEFILKDMHFKIAPGAKVALVGPSGRGKTTLVSLILRLYEVENGRLLVDGVDVSDIKLSTLKSQIGVALEAPFLWNDTIINNILYGLERHSSCASAADIRQEAIWAAQLACAHDFIMSLPKQYDSVIGEMGCKISEGQKQRIAIARAIIKRPKILILDEALSSLDSLTQGQVITNIRGAFSNSTIIVVSHHFSLIQKMDLIYYLESFTQMHTGTFRELARSHVKFRELFINQINKTSDEEIIFSS